MRSKFKSEVLFLGIRLQHHEIEATNVTDALVSEDLVLREVVLLEFLPILRPFLKVQWKRVL